MEKIRIGDKHPGSATLVFAVTRLNPNPPTVPSRKSVATLSVTGTRRRPGWVGSWAASPPQPASPEASSTCSKPASCRSSGKLEYKQFNWIWIFVGLLENFASKNISEKKLNLLSGTLCFLIFYYFLLPLFSFRNQVYGLLLLLFWIIQRIQAI
jgi:hypothetical protein